MAQSTPTTTPIRHTFCSFVFGLLVAFSTTTSSHAQQCSGTWRQTCEKHLTVRAGASVILAHGINQAAPKTCNFLSPQIETTVEPHLGRIVPKVVPFVIPAVAPNGLSNGVCAGKKTKGLQITYFANKETTGTDEVDLKVTGGGVVISSKYIITVQ